MMSCFEVPISYFDNGKAVIPAKAGLVRAAKQIQRLKEKLDSRTNGNDDVVDYSVCILTLL